MRELLERWSSLERERCGISEHAAHLGTPFAFRIHWAVLDADPLSHAAILSAVITAIEARGWTCSLTNNLVQPGTWRAIVWASTARPGTRTYRPSRASDANTPAAALLGAYLVALEAEVVS